MGGKKTDYWRRHVEGFETSGLSQVAYARQHGFTSGALRYWIKRFSKEAKRPRRKGKAFLAVRVAETAGSASPRASLIRVAFPDGIVLETSGEDLTTVARLAEMLRRRAP